MNTNKTIEEEVIGALARGYCSPENEKKVLDPDLIEAMTSEVIKALPAIKNAIYEEIKERIEEYFKGLILIPNPQLTKEKLLSLLKPKE